MLNVEDSILINQYGQGLAEINDILSIFESYMPEQKQKYLREVVCLILQSKPYTFDVEPAIRLSGLKITYTPCVLLMKNGIARRNLYNISSLPEGESVKSLILFLTLFRIAYMRRFTSEKNNPNKWWYWDLSDKNNICKLRELADLGGNLSMGSN